MKDAVEKYVHDGDVVAVGGQNVGRIPVAATHEIIRQRKKNLTLVGCNLSFSMDMMVGAGLVDRTECGTGNVERFGTAFIWRKLIEEGKLKHEDFSHLMMISRFLAAALGVPFMPTMSGFGTDILRHTVSEKKFEIITNPWNEGEKVVLLPALSPDVAIIHLSKADEMGNIIVDGFTAQEPEMVRASKEVIVSCEKLVSSDEVRANPSLTTLPYFFTSAVVEQPFGAYPSSVYRYYDYDNDHISLYQGYAREYLRTDNRENYDGYLDKYIYSCRDFNQFLEVAVSPDQMKELKYRMKTICEGGQV